MKINLQVDNMLAKNIKSQINNKISRGLVMSALPMPRTDRKMSLAVNPNATRLIEDDAYQNKKVLRMLMNSDQQ